MTPYDAAAKTVVFDDTPQADQVLIIVNDTKYGGSGGEIAVSSVTPSALDIPVHEIGHSLFALADEYDTGSTRHSGECSEVNVTKNSNLESVKWNHWTDLPGVGLFVGGHYEATDHYRPVDDCLMKTSSAQMGAV